MPSKLIMKIIYSILIAIVTTTFIFSGDFLTPIVTIGDETKDEYMFFAVDSAAVSTDNSVFVLDYKGNTLSKYNLDGTFIKRVGSKGKGPGDFNFPKNLQLYNGKLYLLDSRNYRLAIIDLKLENFEYIRLSDVRDENNKPTLMLGVVEILNENLFLKVNRLYQKNKSRLVIFDKDKIVNRVAYDYLPGHGKIAKLNSAKGVIFTRPIVGIHHQANLILVTSRYTNRKIPFFVYDFEGKLQKKFFYETEKGFEYPVKYVNTDVGKDDHIVFNLSGIGTIQTYKNYFLVFHNKGKNLSEKTGFAFDCQCLVFTLDGKLVRKVPLGIGFVAVSVSENGYLIAKHDRDEDDEEIKLTVYKINLD